MNIVNIKDVKVISLPKRNIKVLIGSGSVLKSEYMTFGVTTVPPKTKMDSHIDLKEEEIIYILSGYGYVEIDGNKEDLKKGVVIKLPIGSSHYIYNESSKSASFYKSI